MSKFIKGMDLSTLVELEKCGAKYFEDGVEGDVIDILMKYGMNGVRVRIWNDPYSEDGQPYGAGTNDQKTSLEIGKKVRAKGLDLLLDIHYSDFWADPGKQFKPKEWEGYSVDELEQAVYKYTVEVMIAFRDHGACPTMVQVGNELSNGMLWPEGKVPNYNNLAKFVNAGIRGVRKVDKDIPIMIHLDNGGKNELYREWFDNFMQRGEDFQVIGLSYYPFWHGSLEALSNNMNDIAVRYDKELIVAEVSMGYTMEDYKQYEKLRDQERKSYATKQELVETIDYPMTIQGQADFMQDFMDRITKVPKNKGRGFYYWEPAWIPVSGSGWATPAALKYLNDPGPCGNEWANQALFDYEGNTLPALKVIRDYEDKKDRNM